MSLTILEVLKNAQINLRNCEESNPYVSTDIFFKLGRDQLDSAIRALENGKGLYDNWEEENNGD